MKTMLFLIEYDVTTSFDVHPQLQEVSKSRCKFSFTSIFLKINDEKFCCYEICKFCILGSKVRPVFQVFVTQSIVKK